MLPRSVQIVLQISVADNHLGSAPDIGPWMLNVRYCSCLTKSRPTASGQFRPLKPTRRDSRFEAKADVRDLHSGRSCVRRHLVCVFGNYSAHSYVRELLDQTREQLDTRPGSFTEPRSRSLQLPLDEPLGSRNFKMHMGAIFDFPGAPDPKTMISAAAAVSAFRNRKMKKDGLTKGEFNARRSRAMNKPNTTTRRRLSAQMACPLTTSSPGV